MAGSVNKVILVGNLGRDPEIRTTQSGAKVANLSIATSERWTDKSGERQERTEWHRVVILNERLAEFAERFVTKGRLVLVEGSLQTRKWTDRGGEERVTTEIVVSPFRGDLVLLDSPNGAQAERNGQAQRTSAPPPPKGKPASMSDYWKPKGAPASPPPPRNDDLNDEIPW